jgi:hypothetical protein
MESDVHWSGSRVDGSGPVDGRGVSTQSRGLGYAVELWGADGMGLALE